MNVLPQHIIRGDSDKATFKKSVLDVIVRNEDVQFYWLLLSQDIDNIVHAEALLTETVNLWVTIRGFSMAASWMAEYKKNAMRNQPACANQLMECHYFFFRSPTQNFIEGLLLIILILKTLCYDWV